MFQVRIHGRRGQGLVTTVELLTLAAFRDNRWAQVSPTFGLECVGAPVVSFCRIDNEHIRMRDRVVEPDAIIVNDATLLDRVPVFAGISASSYLLLNATQSFDELGISDFA